MIHPERLVHETDQLTSDHIWKMAAELAQGLNSYLDARWLEFNIECDNKQFQKLFVP